MADTQSNQESIAKIIKLCNVIWHWDKTNKGDYHFKWCELFVPREWIARKSLLIFEHDRNLQVRLQSKNVVTLNGIPKTAFILFLLTRDNRDLKQMATATFTTAAGSKIAQKWRSAHAWKLPSAVPLNPTTWGSVLWCSLHYYFSPFFFFFRLSRVLNPIIYCFSLYQKSIWRFWFSSNYVFLAFY